MDSKKFHCFLFFKILLSFLQISFATNTTKVEFNVGVLLDLDEVVGKVRLDCMSMALSDFYATHPSCKTRLVLHARNSHKDVIGAASAALDLLKNMEVQAIIGLETSPQANLVADLGSRSHVPLLSFSRTSPSLSSLQNPYFITGVQNDSSQLGAIVDILKTFRWKEIIAIYEENDYGNQGMSHLIDAFQENEIRISYASAIYSSSTEEQISEELQKLKKMQSKVFVVHVTPSLGSRLFQKVQEMGIMSEGYAFIITDRLTNVLGSMDSLTINSMQGVLGVRAYISETNELKDFKLRWKKEFMETTQLSIFELWAYDTVWALAMAVEKVGGFDHNFFKPNFNDNSSYLRTHGVSKIGPKLVQAISNITFRGLSGEFHLVNRQLQASLFQIVNVIGRQWREIGIWSPQYGVMRDINNATNGDLRHIIWPGESLERPKGWSFSTNGRKLRIAVPVVYGFDELVKVTWDHNTESLSFTGYCVDLFDTVMKELPYKVPYEFIAYEFNESIGSNAAGVVTYNNMLYQVYLQKVDAVVGDISITANRSLYVDFTVPFTETGLSIVMPMKDNNKIDMWLFLKPLSKEMWAASTCALITVGIVIWILEHSVNNSLVDSVFEQLGMVFWFSFSTVVFAHKERLVSNLSRFVLIIWTFVVLILTSSYTASLSSMLTMQQLDGGDINQLMKSGSYIGYQSKVVKGLLNRLGFDDSKLKKLNSLNEFEEALSRGSKRGGVSAIIDEIPYLKLFLNKYCDKYYMARTIYNTNGFGFVFQKGSPLVVEVSKALFDVKETEKLKYLELKWFNNFTDCDDPGSKDSPEGITVDRYRGLFLVTVISSMCALLLFFAFKHVHSLKNKSISGDGSKGNRFFNLVKLFNKEDSYYVLKASELNQVEVTKPEKHTSTSSCTDTSSPRK